MYYCWAKCIFCCCFGHLTFFFVIFIPSNKLHPVFSNANFRFVSVLVSSSSSNVDNIIVIANEHKYIFVVAFARYYEIWAYELCFTKMILCKRCNINILSYYTYYPYMRTDMCSFHLEQVHTVCAVCIKLVGNNDKQQNVSNI